MIIINVDYSINELIKIYIEPLIEEECKRLNIPREIIKGVYGCRKLGIAGYCEPLNHENKLLGLKIRISECSNARDALQTFFHEMFHSKEFVYGSKILSELRAFLYAEKRILQHALSGWKYLR